MAGTVGQSIWDNVVVQIKPGWEICQFDSDGYEVCGVVADIPQLLHGTLTMNVDWESTEEGFDQVFEAPEGYRTVRLFENAVVISSTDQFWTLNPRTPSENSPASNNGANAQQGFDLDR